MPTVFLREKCCFVCGHSATYPDTSTAGPFRGECDLDTRPSSMHRSSVYMLVQQCEACGYCAQDINRGEPAFKEVVHSALYRELRANQSLSQTAVSFQLQAMLLEHVHDTKGAGWAWLHAAWVNDDGGERANALLCRRKALDYFNQVRSQGESCCATPSLDTVLLVDLYRRVKDFDRASRLAELELELETCPPEVRRALTWEVRLARSQNSRTATMAQALEESDDE